MIKTEHATTRDALDLPSHARKHYLESAIRKVLLAEFETFSTFELAEHLFPAANVKTEADTKARKILFRDLLDLAPKMPSVARRGPGVIKMGKVRRPWIWGSLETEHPVCPHCGREL